MSTQRRPQKYPFPDRHARGPKDLFVKWMGHDAPRHRFKVEVTVHPWHRVGIEAVDNGRSLWEADHITPVAEGGGFCDLENYRTLCRWCHQIETRALAGRLAQKRREEKIALALASRTPIL